MALARQHINSCLREVSALVPAGGLTCCSKLLDGLVTALALLHLRNSYDCIRLHWQAVSKACGQTSWSLVPVGQLACCMSGWRSPS